MTDNDRFTLFLSSVNLILLIIATYLAFENTLLESELLKAKKIAIQESERAEEYKAMMISLNIELEDIEDVYMLINNLQKERR